MPAKITVKVWSQVFAFNAASRIYDASLIDISGFTITPEKPGEPPRDQWHQVEAILTGVISKAIGPLVKEFTRNSHWKSISIVDCKTDEIILKSTK